MKVHLLVPVAREIQPATVQWILELMQTGLLSDYSQHVGNAWIDQARTNLQDLFLQGSADAALLVDSDISAPGTGLLRAMVACASTEPVIAQMYAKRASTGLLVGAFDPDHTGLEVLDGERLARIRETGLGCALIRRDVFAALEPLAPRHRSIVHDRIVSNPYFPRVVDEEYCGDDRSFFGYVREAGYRPATLVDRAVTHDGVTMRAIDAPRFKA